MSDPFTIGTGVFLVGTLFLIGGFQALRKLRVIENTLTSKIRSIAMGLVEIKGQPVPRAEPLISPITRQECVYYDYKIEEIHSETEKEILAEGQQGNRFYLQDETGTVLIDSRGARFKITPSYDKGTSSLDSTPDEVRGILERENIDYRGTFGVSKTVRITEHIIVPQRQIYIMGTAMDNPHVENTTSTNNTEDIIIGQGDEKNYFFISDEKEQQITKKLRSFARLGLVAGPPLIILGISFALTA